MARRDGEGFRSWYEPPRRRGEASRLAACALLVSAVASVGAELLTRVPAGPASTDMPDAVEVDLPPALASSLPKSEAPDGPAQHAAEAVPPVPPPEPLEDTPPVPPPPEALDPAAAIRKEEVPPPPPVATAPAQEEQAPAGAAVPDAVPVKAEPAAKPPHARAIAAWQRAMVERVKRDVHRREHLEGIVEVAFAIDRRGSLTAKSVRKSSGNAVLDRTALDLLAAAAPFPQPPRGLDEAGLSFTVPVRFR